jgi:hypothetical protein
MATLLQRIANHVGRRLRPDRAAFPGSAAYWEQRYHEGGDSGVGSYGKFADFKAEVLNDFVARHGVGSIIEFGCGDGNQLGFARYPRYLGFDVSDQAIARCRSRFASDTSKAFLPVSQYSDQTAHLVLSLDVIFHLVEDAVYFQYMKNLFQASERYVIIYSSNQRDSGKDGAHVRHRRFTDWVTANEPKWRLEAHIPNRYPYQGDYREGSFADFYVFAWG